MNKQRIQIPEWFRSLPGNAYLNSKEIIRLFGYSENNSVSELMKRGSIPMNSRICEKSFHRNLMWMVRDVRQFLIKTGYGK